MDILHAPQKNASPLNAELLLEIAIPTATILVISSADPYQFLMGSSNKHGKPVLPGGKIDCKDMVGTSMLDWANAAAIREFSEELGICAPLLTPLTVLFNLNRDTRIITAGSLRGTLVESLVEHLRDNELVRGRYGVPDYVFLARLNPGAIPDTEELSNLRWSDARLANDQTLGAGHLAVITEYLRQGAA